VKVIEHFWVWGLFLARQPPVGQGLLIHEVSRSHTTTHHSRQDCSGRVIGPSQRPLPDNTQHSQQTNFHAHSGIRTQNLSRQAAVDLRLRRRSRWDRLLLGFWLLKRNKFALFNVVNELFYLHHKPNTKFSKQTTPTSKNTFGTSIPVNHGNECSRKFIILSAQVLMLYSFKST
jgi:hypothetical protein